MGGVTPRGYPYVVSTDHPLEAPAHSQALANKLEAGPFVARGVVSVPVVTAGTQLTPVAVTFPVGLFTGVPAVTVSASSGRITASVTTVTATGATLQFSNWTPAATGGTAAGYWVAVGV